jgi:hypothetical protein
MLITLQETHVLFSFTPGVDILDTLLGPDKDHLDDGQGVHVRVLAHVRDTVYIEVRSLGMDLTVLPMQ